APPLPTITAIQEGRIQLADGSMRPIPHYGDPAYTIIYALRHCEKVKDGSRDPELSPAGKARAERLGKVMDLARLDRICTTNTKRTVATGAAVQYWAGGPPTETFPAEAQADWLTETLATSAGKNLFYVGHTNTIPQLLNQLTGKDHYKELPEDEFGRFYIAVTKGPGQTEVLELLY
ncbi:MAG: phosphoglycerate mutase family protein, partial [Saprospiraceae bacterium]